MLQFLKSEQWKVDDLRQVCSAGWAWWKVALSICYCELSDVAWKSTIVSRRVEYSRVQLQYSGRRSTWWSSSVTFRGRCSTWWSSSVTFRGRRSTWWSSSVTFRGRRTTLWSSSVTFRGRRSIWWSSSGTFGGRRSIWWRFECKIGRETLYFSIENARGELEK